ncbi:hypothetical protein RUE5091_01564 [Ruegeria denitrificans]|uniref:Uncharacterized protein n=1 Tax=Ruegeria denitrificans TaxID=1715692 RepID=A0A0P1IQ99_9RHOB|nr:hypothetical protein RUE5091_01564 [Ruegeria denitrificans]
MPRLPWCNENILFREFFDDIKFLIEISGKQVIWSPCDHSERSMA